MDEQRPDRMLRFGRHRRTFTTGKMKKVNPEKTIIIAKGKKDFFMLMS
jgi:hypothetical protein